MRAFKSNTSSKPQEVTKYPVQEEVVPNMASLSRENKGHVWLRTISANLSGCFNLEFHFQFSSTTPNENYQEDYELATGLDKRLKLLD